MSNAHGGGKPLNLRAKTGSDDSEEPKRATRRDAAVARGKTKKSNALTLRDRLSRLTLPSAAALLGANGARLIATGSRYEVNIPQQVFLGNDLFRLTFPGLTRGRSLATVTITTMASARNRLHWNCTACSLPCEHVGTALSLVLEEKVALGLAAPPPDDDPSRPATEEELIEQALADRQERAETEKMKVVSADSSRPWTDYSVTSTLSGKTYRVALRGLERGMSYWPVWTFARPEEDVCPSRRLPVSRLPVT